MSLTKLEGPFLKTPACHVVGNGGWNLYMGGVCAKMEINLHECIEAYGYDKGMKYCRGFLDDFYECQRRRKQIRRRDAMEQERGRQYSQGLIKERYVPPPDRDAY